MRPVSLLITLLCALVAGGAYAAPTNSGGRLDFSSTEYQVSFDASTDDSPSISVGGTCAVTATIVGSGTITLYQVENSSDAASSGVAVAAFTASTTTQTTFAPGYSAAKAVASSAGLAGSSLKILCSYVDITAAPMQTDRDGDGFYEYLSFPADYDGDGSGVTICTGEETPDPACLFAGEKVWRDAADDVNAAVDHLAVGGVIEVSGDWIFPIRPRVCSEDDSVSCDEDSQCSGTCVAHQGYTAVHSYPSGKLRTEAAREKALHPTFNKTGMTFRGSGMDINNSLDGVRTGTWWVDDKNDDSQTPTPTGGNVSLWAVGVGNFRRDTQSYGEGYADITVNGSGENWEGRTGQVQVAYNSGEVRLCVESTFADVLVPGDRVMVEKGTYLESGADEDAYPVAIVTDVYNNSSQVTEENVAPCNDDPPDMRTIHLSISDWDSPASFADSTLVIVDEEMWTADITAEKFNYMPQNPFQQNNYGNDNPVLCGSPTDWDGTSDRSTQPDDCDTGAGIGIFSGIRHTVQKVATHHHSNLSAGVYDGQDACYGCSYRFNYIGPGRVAASAFDTGNGWQITDNWFELGPNSNAGPAAAIRTLGDNVRIERNTFVGVGRLQCSTEPAVACFNGGECAGSCLPSSSAMFSFKNGSTWFVDNYIYGGTGGTNATGGVMTIDTSDFTMTGNRFVNTSGSNQYDISITSGANNVNIHNNQFLYRRQYQNANNGGNIFVTEGATNISITDNQFTWSDPNATTPDDYWPAAIRLSAGAEDSLLTTEINVNGNSFTGYVGPMLDTGSGYLPPVYPPTGERANFFNGDWLSEKGDVAYGSIPTCDSHADTGVAYYVTDSDTCTGSGGSGTRCACLWDGAGVAAGDFDWTEIDTTP